LSGLLLLTNITVFIVASLLIGISSFRFQVSRVRGGIDVSGRKLAS
jgi:F0F1-type ATP synthase assembly protein I